MLQKDLAPYLFPPSHDTQIAVIDHEAVKVVCKVGLLVCYTYLSVFCRKHEWFQKDLASYLFPPPHDTQIAVIDQEAVKEVCEVGALEAVSLPC